MKEKPAIRDEAAKATLVQRRQIEEQEDQQAALRKHTVKLTEELRNQSDTLETIESSMADLWREIGRERPSDAELEDVKPLERLELDDADHEEIDTAVAQLDFSTTIIRADGDWASYVRSVEEYARSNGIDLTGDPFQSLLSTRQRSEILERIETDFDEKCDCDRWDYATAACCGALSGLVDAFLVGVPRSSLLGGLSDKAADRLVERFAKVIGWKGPPRNSDPTRSAIAYLERRFGTKSGINYDQRHTGDVGGAFKMSTRNHHIKSLAHSPSPIGLLFSVLDQFTGHASFVADGRLIRIRTDGSGFSLQGSTLPSKLFAAFVNWIGHILSDMAGASGTTEGRGMGVPIPFFELLQFANVGSFDDGEEKRTLAELAVKMFEEGYDARFGAALAVPVLVNELLIRIVWVVKRRYYHGYHWGDCKPSGDQPSLRRMLLVGHGSLVLVDLGDAAVRGGGQPAAMLIHMNFVAWMRFGYLGLREAHRLFNREAERMRRIDDTIDAELTALLADSTSTPSLEAAAQQRPSLVHRHR